MSKRATNWIKNCAPMEHKTISHYWNQNNQLRGTCKNYLESLQTETVWCQVEFCCWRFAALPLVIYHLRYYRSMVSSPPFQSDATISRMKLKFPWGRESQSFATCSQHYQCASLMSVRNRDIVKFFQNKSPTRRENVGSAVVVLPFVKRHQILNSISSPRSKAFRCAWYGAL